MKDFSQIMVYLIFLIEIITSTIFYENLDKYFRQKNPNNKKNRKIDGIEEKYENNEKDGLCSMCFFL